MKRFYFTYGTEESQPFRGGWSEVMADDLESAIKLFDMVHPRKSEFLNCSSIYSEDDFKNTSMHEKGNNFGAGCHEVISLQVISKN